uniref:Uncharacterized protein n=1 Tax=Arundo donax TaxID=35708 RepID=A0A0A9FVE7_ARUDO
MVKYQVIDQRKISSLTRLMD